MGTLEKLEKCFDLMVNEEIEAARRVLRSSILEKAHTILREMEEEDGEGALTDDIQKDLNEIDSEELFVEEENQDDAADAGDDLASSEAGDDEADAGSEGDDADAGTEGQDDGSAEGDSTEQRLTDVEDDIERLKAEMNELWAKEDGVEGDLDGIAADADADAATNATDGDDEFAVGADDGAELDEDFFEDLTEAKMADFLEEIKANNEGKEIGASGKAVKVNDDAALPSEKPANRIAGATPIKYAKGETVSGFPDMSKGAPSVKDGSIGKNALKSASAGVDKVAVQKQDKSKLIGASGETVKTDDDSALQPIQK